MSESVGGRSGRGVSAWLKRTGIILFVVVLVGLVIPRWWCGRGADAVFRGEASAHLPLARGVSSWVQSDLGLKDFSTGHDLFDGEWLFGTYQMAGLGLCQLIRMHPDTRDEFLPAVRACLERIESDEVRAFDRNRWNEDPLASLNGKNGHAAYLGYYNLALGLYQELADDPDFRERHQRISEALIARLQTSRLLLLETYPGEVYPVDNTAVIASIAVYDRVTGSDHSSLIAAWEARCREQYVDAESGMLIQAVGSTRGHPLDKPRSSGTALGAYFLSIAGMELGRDLYERMKQNCEITVFGFGGLKEYPPNVEAGRGDIDSGPVVFGLSFSGTGFVAASARTFDDPDYFERLYRTSTLLGIPFDSGGERSYVMGGPLGNAILLAMHTAGGAK